MRLAHPAAGIITQILIDNKEIRVNIHNGVEMFEHNAMINASESKFNMTNVCITSCLHLYIAVLTLSAPLGAPGSRTLVRPGLYGSRGDGVQP